jgi:hypothetical protein
MNEHVNGADVAGQVAEEKAAREVDVSTVGGPRETVSVPDGDGKDPAAQQEGVRVVITLTPDGNVRVDGPLANQPLYFYMLRVAGRIGDEYADSVRRRAQQAQAAAEKEPFWKRKIREAKERKEREAAAQAAAPKTTDAATT